METKEKIRIVKKLEEEIDNLESFIDLAKIGDIFDTKYNGQNMFTGLNISANIYTGTDNPRYEKGIREGETISAFIKAGLQTLESILKLKKEELEGMFTS